MRKNKLYNCLPEVNVIHIIVLRYQNSYNVCDTFYDNSGITTQATFRIENKNVFKGPLCLKNI